MILVINLNASIDKKYEMADIEKGEVSRARAVQNTPGGKGIHVANVATLLNEECIVTGYLGGKSGEFIEEELENYGIKQDFVKIDGETRSCLAIIADDGSQTEILEPGPSVSKEELDRFIVKYKELLEAASIVVASGSVPKNVPSDFYCKLIELAKEKDKKFLLDTSGKLLEKGIEAAPFFIKPNKDEIEALTGKKMETESDVVEEIKKFHESGVELVAVSLGGSGSIVGFEDKIYKVTFPKVNVVNPVGSGDSYVSGIAIGLERGYDIKSILKLASACGTANAMESESGFVREAVVNELLSNIKVEEI